MLNRESLWFLTSPFGSDSNKKKPQKCGFFRYNRLPIGPRRCQGTLQRSRCCQVTL